MEISDQDISVTPEDIINWVSNLNMWSRGGEVAPHKPLMLLYMLGQIQQGNYPRQLFAHVRKNIMPAKIFVLRSDTKEWAWYPFWHLHDGKFWRLEAGHKEPPLASQLPPKCPKLGGRLRPSSAWSEKVNGGLYGGFTDQVARLLIADKALISQCIWILLKNNFQPTWHMHLINIFGLFKPEETYQANTPDFAFQAKVMEAYKNRCAVCDFTISLGKMTVGRRSLPNL